MTKDVYVLIEHVRGKVNDISYILLAAARVLVQENGGRVVAVLLGNNSQDLANDLPADHVLYFEHSALAEYTSESYQKVLRELIKQDMPRAFLMGDTTIGSEVAGLLSISLELPLVSRCHTVDSHANFVCQICGGKILAEGVLPDSPTLIAMVPGGYKPEIRQGPNAPEIITRTSPELDHMHINLIKYIEPESADVDITKIPILVSVGRGIQNEDNIELAEELATALGGAVSGSRPVIDQGWLPTTRLVGKSGHTVKPKIYLALGISGAPEHVEAITGSDMIIAINTDPAAPIFNIAKYGVNADIFDLIEPLTDMVKQVKEARA